MSLFGLVLLSLLGLALGPLLAASMRTRPLPTAALDGFTFGLVPAVLLLRIFPHLFASLGLAAPALGALGYLLIVATDRSHRGAGERLTPVIVYPALLIHSFTDGALLAALALSLHAGSAGIAFGTALVLHRMPEGLFLVTVAPNRSPTGTVLRLSGLMAATVAGAVLGNSLFRLFPDAAFDAVAAVGFGAMLRLSIHSHAPAPTTTASRLASVAAFAAGLIAVVAIKLPGDILRATQIGEPSLLQTVVALYVETAPAVLVGLLLAIMLGRIHALGRRRSALFVGLFLSWQLLGWQLTLLRSVATALVLAVARTYSDDDDEAADSFADVLERALPPYLVGLLVAAGFEAFLPLDLVDLPLTVYAVILPLTTVGALRPIGMTLAAAVLLHRGLDLPPVMVVLTLAALGHRRSTKPATPIAVLLAATIAAVVALATRRFVDASSVPPLHLFVSHPHRVGEYACAIGLGGLALGALARRGPRLGLSFARA